MNPPKSPLILLACAALSVALAACGSNGNGSTSPSSPAASSPAPATSAPASSSAPAASSAAASTIAANWTAFFSAKTPVAKRISLLEDGQDFAAVIKGQAGSGLASAASAKVTKVTVTSPTQATVGYDILIGGQPALSNQSGTAVLQDGTWKVGLSSFCSLLTLEAGGNPVGLPAQCQAAG
ncbi:MAG TPA: hypothetical protein VK586_07700 [Streptosporangiaceae bacterium]|nr:hypothetical protein [Streptosporangiaceae bacterium]